MPVQIACLLASLWGALSTAYPLFGTADEGSKALKDFSVDPRYADTQARHTDRGLAYALCVHHQARGDCRNGLGKDDNQLNTRAEGALCDKH